MISLEGRTAIVTGAARGIGEACARAMARHGARTVLADVLEDECRAAAGRIADETGRDALAVRADVSEEADCAAVLAACVERFGGCDVLVNNAGVIVAGSILDADPADFDRVLAVNLRGTFLMSRAVARHMVRRQAKGAIVNMSSTNAVVTIPDQLAYAASKGAIAQLTKAMAVALAPHGIRVNAIGPGTIMTDMLGVVVHDAAVWRTILSRTPAGRIGEPDEVASVAVFLASDYASYVTGDTVYPDGGRLALNYTVPVVETGAADAADAADEASGG